MKSYHANSGGGLASLVLREHDEPVPGRRQALVRVRASSLNFRELSVLRGTYPLPVKPDVIMGADGAGEVVALGPEVARLRVGDRVAASMFPRWLDGPIAPEYAPQIGGSLDGMLTECVALDEDALVRIPDHLSFEEAATLPCSAVTAWNALTGARSLHAGDVILTQGSGSVSRFALQLARLSGARVIATTSSDAKAERLCALGASAVVNYRTTADWPGAARRLTGGRGVDQVIDVAGSTLGESIRATALGGSVAFVGRLGGGPMLLDTGALYQSVTTVRVVFAGNRGHFEAMNRAIAVAGMRPVIDRVFSFEEVPAAFRYFEERRPFGKVVIRVG